MVISPIFSEPFRIFHMYIAALVACIPRARPVEWFLSIIFFLSKAIICVECSSYHLVPEVLIISRELEVFGEFCEMMRFYTQWQCLTAI